MKRTKFAENSLIVLGMLSLQLVIWLAGFQMALGSIQIIGGCGKLGSLRYYCGNGAVPAAFGAVPLALALLLPPILIKALASHSGRVSSWRRIGILYVVTLLLTIMVYGIINVLSLHHHGV